MELFLHEKNFSFRDVPCWGNQGRDRPSSVLVWSQFDYLALGSGPNFDSFYVADRLIAFPESKAKQIENAYGFKSFVALDD